ncbi:MAG: SUF system NifU family Fe-S cluster assembly protein [Oligoflexus sp.]|nr:SUF system NifU family Fe-S cluster assembly protein [Oligoflexus sp.]
MNEEWKSLILDHYKHPRHYGDMKDFTFASEQHNRTCGDHVKVFATIDDQGTATFSFLGAGCSLCLASASLMMELVHSQNKSGIEAVRQEFQNMMKKGASPDAIDTWKALDGLRQYPVRSRCVKLAWQALDEIYAEWNTQKP